MPLSPEANAIVTDFGKQPGVLPEYEQNLRHAIDRSPALMDEVNRAVKEGRLEHIQLLDAHANASGQYLPGDRAMQIKPGALSNEPTDPQARANDPYQDDRKSLTNTLGHEVQHALNAERIEQAERTFESDIQRVASSPQRDHDYTQPIGKMVKENLRDEAGGQISGWNADVSAAQKEFAEAKRGPLTLGDLYQRNVSDAQNFIDVGTDKDGKPTYTLKPNLELNPDLSMPLTDRNVEGITKNLLTDPHLGLGPSGTSEYRNYYGAGLVSEAVKAERAYAVGRPAGDRAEMSVNLAELGMNRRTLEENGLALGVDRSPMPFLDKSTNPPTASHFHDTRDTFQYVADPQKQGPTRLDDPSHPDHGMFQQARGHVQALDRQLGRTPDQHTDNIASAVTVSARADGLSRIDQVALSQDGSKLFAVQTPPGSRDHFFDKVTSVPTAAANTSMEQSAAQWPQAMDKYQQHEQAQGHAQAQAQQQSQAQAQQPSGPVQQIGGR